MPLWLWLIAILAVGAMGGAYYACSTGTDVLALAQAQVQQRVGDVALPFAVPDWVWPALPVVAVFLGLLLLVSWRRLFLQFLREPIGLGVPLALIGMALLVPQVPDMLLVTTPTEGQGPSLPRLIAVPVAALLLAFSAWFWTRAAIGAAYKVDDAARKPMRGRVIEEDPLPWEARVLPRFAVAPVVLITVAPLLVIWRSSGACPEPSVWIASGAGLVLNLFVLWFAFSGRSRLSFVASRPAPRWMWGLNTTALLAGAPLSWPLAVLMLQISGGAIWAVGTHPELVERFLSTPAAAMGAMALLIGPLSLTLAILRDVCLLVLLLPAAAIGAAGRLQPTARWLGLAVLAWLTFAPPALWEQPGRYAVRRADAPLAEPVQDGACRPDAAAARPCLREALTEWYEARKADLPEGARMPVVIVAAQGGGSRAAAWSLAAMRLLDEKTQGQFGRQTFAISAVSGGALGAGSYLLAQRLHGDLAARHGEAFWQQPPVQRLVGRTADGDLLAVAIATYFLNDTLAPAWGPLWPFAADRGIALERAFERHWAAALGGSADPGTLLALRPRGEARLPHLLLNGTDSVSGRRAITSTIRFAPGDDVFASAEDLLAELRPLGAGAAACAPAAAALDVPLSTAVLNSARFPFVSPAGRFNATACRDDRQVLDGGYFETYGARTALELAGAIERLARQPGSQLRVVPIVVLLSNDADGWVDAEAAARGLAVRGRLPADPAERQALLDQNLLQNRAMHCDGAPAALPPALLARRGGGGGVVPMLAPVADSLSAMREGGASILPQAIAPAVGLYATRGAHGQDALHLLRRTMCADAQAPAGSAAREQRLFHVALPAPDPGAAEAAPMNWVMSPRARKLLVETGPQAAFNQQQAALLAATFGRLRSPQ